jgi:hypothetical protein
MFIFAYYLQALNFGTHQLKLFKTRQNIFNVLCSIDREYVVTEFSMRNHHKFIMIAFLTIHYFEIEIFLWQTNRQR